MTSPDKLLPLCKPSSQSSPKSCSWLLVKMECYWNAAA